MLDRWISGSDKSIDFIGLAAAIDKLSNAILQSWDRVRFAKSAKTSASIKTASEGILLISQIATATEHGAMTPEEAEKMRRTVIKSIDDLFANGVYTKAMETVPPFQPDQLIVERRKLITHYGSGSRSLEKRGTAREGESPSENDISDE